MKLHSLLLLLLLLALSACGHGSRNLDVDPVPAGNPPAGLAGLSLPRPSALPKSSSAPPMEFERFTQGSYTLFGFPENKYIDTGDNGLFLPSYSLPDSGGIANAAYGTYSLYNMTEYAGPAQIMHQWATPPTDWGNAFLAVANFSNDRWDWYAMDEGPVAIPGWSDYCDVQGQVYLLVLLLGTDPCELDWLIGGDSVHSEDILHSDKNNDPTMNLAPLTLNFTALSGYYGTSITGYDWDFEGDGTVDISNDTDGKETYVYELPGAYTCKVTFHTADGKQSEAELSFTAVDPLNMAPVADLSANVSVGDAPLVVTLDASGSTDDDSIVKYEWDIDGDGEYEYDTAAVPNLDYTFVRNGNTAVTVRVTDNDFASDTSTLNINLDSGWRTVVIDDTADVRGLAMAVNGSGIGSRAMVTYCDGASDDLFFSRANSDLGTGWSAPVEPVDNSIYVLDAPDMTVNPITDRPQLAFMLLNDSVGRELRFVSSSDVNGSIWDPSVSVSTDTDFGYSFSIASSSNGNPAILAQYGVVQGQKSVRYYHASNTTGSAWEQPVLLGDLGFNQHVNAVDLLYTGSYPVGAVSGYYEDGGGSLGLLAASSGNGMTWDALDLVDIFGGYEPSLAMVSGRPAMAAGVYGQGASLYYLRADDAEGRNWTAQVQELAPAGIGGKAALAVVGGKPAIAWHSFGNEALMYMSAVDADGSSWNEAFAVDSTTYFDGDEIALVSSNNFPVIGYSDLSGNRLLAAVWYQSSSHAPLVSGQVKRQCSLCAHAQEARIPGPQYPGQWKA